jgi:segregation and condensation protein B
MTESHIRNVVEAALLAAGKSLQAKELVDLFDEGASQPTLSVVQAILAGLAEEYSTRGIEIKETAAGFRIQVRPGLSNEISRLWPERPPKYSRALLETLALIAYRQPITRAEIESVRGVPVNPNIIKTVIERNWVHVVGHRDVPGRPELLATTRDFLDYFGLRSIDELPPLAEIKAIGEIKVQFDLPDPGQIVPEAGTEATSAPAAAASEDAGAPEAPTAASDEQTGAEAIAAEAAAGGAESGERAAAEEAVAESIESQSEPEVSPEGKANPESNATPDAESASDEKSTPETESTAASQSKPKGRSSGQKKRRGKTQSPETALHEAEEFAASVDADLAGDDDNSDEDELSAAGPDSSELVAGPRDIDD